MLRFVNLVGQIRNLYAGHGAIAGKVVGLNFINLLDHGSGDLQRFISCLLFHGISTVVPRTSFDCVHFCFGNEVEHIASLVTNILHAQMTSNLVTDVT